MAEKPKTLDDLYPRTREPIANSITPWAPRAQDKLPTGEQTFKGIADLLKTLGPQVSAQAGAPQPIRPPQQRGFTERPGVANAKNAQVTAAPLAGPRPNPQMYSQIAARYSNA